MVKDKVNVMILFIFAFLTIRTIIFISAYGGVEHDSGWYLGVAKNVAERGIYASFTNTIKENTIGAHSSIHGRFSVQDKDGYIYFPAGVTVGPGYVFPEAFILKIFGNGWWQYRAWPLLAFSLLLLLSFYIVKKIGGFFSLGIFALWIYLIPQYYTSYSFEAFSESIATMLFLFGGWLLFGISKKKKLYYFCAGLMFSFAYLTKTLFLLPISSLFFISLYDVIKNKEHKKKIISKWVIVALGLFIPALLFHFYQYVSLISRFGMGGWTAVGQDYEIVLKSAGSGLDNLKLQNFDINFISQKIQIWKDIALDNSYLVWIFLIFSPLLLFRSINRKYREFIVFCLLAMFISFIWYVFFSTFGWARHAWQALFIGMIIIAITIGTSLSIYIKRKEYVNVALISIVAIFSINFSLITPSFLLSEKHIDKWMSTNHIRGIQGFPGNPILSLADQKELVVYSNDNISENDKVYYAGWFLNAEASALTGKVFFTLDRYFVFNQRNPAGGKSYIIFGPYQKGPQSFMPQDYILQKEKELCAKKVFENPSYTLCTLNTDIIYNNPAYN